MVKYDERVVSHSTPMCTYYFNTMPYNNLLCVLIYLICSLATYNTESVCLTLRSVTLSL